MASYMTNKDFAAIMDENGWRMSEAVKLYLVKASHCFKQHELMAKAVKAHPDNQPLQAEYRRLDEDRANYVWQALDTAKAEHTQGWRYLEDGSDFVSTMLIKYEGDLSQCTWLEQLKSEYIDILSEMRQNQIKKGD